MEYGETPAPAPLDALVRCFWFLRGDDLGSDPQVIVPDGRLEIILHLAEPFHRLDAEDRAHVQAQALVSGQLTAPLRLRPGGPADIVGIRFRTAAACAVLPLPLAELTDRVEPLADALPQLARSLETAAARNNTVAARVAALAHVLTRFVVRTPDPLATAVIRSLDTSESLRLGLIADLYGVSARTLERKRREHAGLPLNVLRRLLRFRRAFRMLDQAPPGTWARVAARAGYFDQAHLIRDFRRFAGAAPSEFFRAEPDLARAILGVREHSDSRRREHPNSRTPLTERA
ncbi:MAG: AraC family transcriptional regulator [Gemmatimonadaceae bacterium]